MEKGAKKIISTNRKAKLSYAISETYEAGIALKGDEVKSLRGGKCSVDESFARIERSGPVLYNLHIPEFSKSSYFKSDPKRPRKLLLNKKEISRLWGLTSQSGYTLIPLKVYFNNKGIAKIEIGVGKGRKLYDKRRKLREKYQKRDTDRAMRRYK